MQMMMVLPPLVFDTFCEPGRAEAKARVTASAKQDGEKESPNSTIDANWSCDI